MKDFIVDPATKFDFLPADFVVVDHKMNVKQVFLKGEIVR